jgi:DNA-binding winged helix-turn-helix (wHTH) protein
MIALQLSQDVRWPAQAAGDQRLRSVLSSIDLGHEPDFALGALRVSPSTREVMRAGWTESLEPRVMQVLVALSQVQGRVVSRDDLIARCWEGRVVGEDAINRAIGRLRKLARTDQGASFVIETIPRIGYRLRVAALPARGGWWNVLRALRGLMEG